MLSMKKFSIQTELPVTILREGKSYIAYTPALDISTVGKTHEEAQKRFVELVEIFFQELSEMGTLEEVLKSLGWSKVRSKWFSPVVVSQNSILISA